MLKISYNLDIGLEAIRQAIKNDLKYTYKKVYFRSYEKDSKDVIKTRYWLAFHMFYEKYFERKYVVFMDESGINNTSFK